MSRNKEKSQSMLFRFKEQQAAELGIVDIGRTQRPRNVSKVDSVAMCEKWRGQVIRDISFKVTKIQDESLSEYQIRDLNDEINKLMREKHAWEIRIRELGGPNYIRFAKQKDENGEPVPMVKGYRYFGRAKELPDVKEILDAQRERLKEQMKGESSKLSELKDQLVKAKPNLDAEYYGFEDYSEWPELEAEFDELSRLRTEALRQENPTQPDFDPSTFEPIAGDMSSIPSQSAVEKWLVEKQKQKLRDALL